MIVDERRLLQDKRQYRKSWTLIPPGRSFILPPAHPVA
jgi:hypothetical protein